MRTGQGRRYSAWRRATYLKRTLNRNVIRWVDNSYELDTEPTFILDVDFDLVCDDRDVYIWRPSTFESLLGLQAKVREATQVNISRIESAAMFLDLSGIAEYVSGSMRAARCLSSIAHDSPSSLKIGLVVAELQKTNVPHSVNNGKLSVDPSDALDFLYVLDRRRYVSELTTSGREVYSASSRRKVN